MPKEKYPDWLIPFIEDYKVEPIVFKGPIVTIGKVNYTVALFIMLIHKEDFEGLLFVEDNTHLITSSSLAWYDGNKIDVVKNFNAKSVRPKYILWRKS